MPRFAAQLYPPRDGFDDAIKDREDALRMLYNDMSKIAFGDVTFDLESRVFARESLRAFELLMKPPQPT